MPSTHSLSALINFGKIENRVVAVYSCGNQGRSAPENTEMTRRNAAERENNYMRVVIQENYDKMCKWAADYISGRINAHNNGPEAGRPFVLGLPTGSSPIGVYKELARMNKAGEVSFANVVTFNMDEYLGCPTSMTRATGTSCTTTSLIIWSI